jgi:DNA uptake protein ComE-like DNA-binding protein
MTKHWAVGRLMGALALALALLAHEPARAQIVIVKGLIDPNSAAEADLQALPAMTPAIVKGIVERRPFKSVVELNKFLLDQKVTPEQAREFYRKAFVPINLNTGTREEFMLIPGVGSRMSAEFMEYRPWKTWTQFDREIGKYVGQAETDRFKQYVFIPSN